ncbi:TPA: hypothetical protein ACH0WI_001195, partial [Raoultella planticola]
GIRFCNLPGGATLARAYPEQRLRGLPEQRLRGPTRNNAYAGLPETALARACRNSAFVGRVRRQPPPDAGASRTAAMVKRV